MPRGSASTGHYRAAISLALTLAFSAAAEETPAAGPPELEIHGNIVMPDEVYLSVVDLPPDAIANAETATLVREQILSFLLRAGYELAQVHVAYADNTLRVDVDEGQLEKVVFRGKLTLQTLRFKLGLVLPYDVFNRPELDREIKKLQTELKLERVWYELVPTQQVAHIGPQVESLPEIQGLQLVHARRGYELHVFFTEHPWDTGAWFDLKSGFPDGTELGAVYQGSHLLFLDDRYKVTASGGVNLRNHIVDNSFYLAPSRAFGEVRYYSPELGHGLGRAFLWLIEEGTARQRPDQCIENYYHVRGEATLNLQYQLAPQMTISYGGGTQYRHIYAGSPPQGSADAASTVPCWGVQPSLGQHLIRSFGIVRTDLIFNTGAERWDRRHALWAELRYYISPRTDGINVYGDNVEYRPTFGELRAAYQKVWSFGWHDFWLRSRGAWLWGEVFFHDEEPIGRHLRGVFGSEYVHHAASISGEFRFSITRDLYKLSVFNDLVVYGHLNERSCPAGTTPDQNPNANYFPCYVATSQTRSFGDTSEETPVIADAFGAGFHALVEGMIQVDIYFSVGWRSGPGVPPAYGQLTPTPLLANQVTTRWDTGGAISLEKVF